MGPVVLFAIPLVTLPSSHPAAGHIPAARAQDERQCPVDTNKVTYLPFERFLVPDLELRPAGRPTLNVLEEAECLIEDRIAQWNEFESYSKDLRIRDTRDYYRQCCLLQDRTGHQLVYVNAFCGQWQLDHWRRQWVVVEDGGTCYFQALVDLTSRKVLLFSVNGIG